MEPVRLQKYLSDAGVCSRRAAEALIEAGEITVNGEPAALGQRVTPGVDRVAVRGRPVHGPAAAAAPKVSLLVNKPKGVVCGTPDGRHPETVFDLIPKAHAKLRFLIVGRLDLETEGLVLLTSDGALADRLSRTGSRLTRRFLVSLRQPFPSARLPQLTRGVRIEEETVRADHAFLLRPGPEEASQEIEVHIAHGRGRGLRELFTTLGFDVKRIQCVQIGGIRIHGIPLRDARVLTSHDLELLSRSD